MEKRTDSGRYLKNTGGKRRSASVKILSAVAVCLALVLAGMVFYVNHLNQAEQDFSELSQLAHSVPPEKSTTPAPRPTSENTNTEESVPETERAILPKFLEIHDQNSDFYGWLQIEGTKIDYPVMFTPENPEKYLRANFQGEYSRCGTPFIDGNSIGDQDNTIIYGHNMRDGSMFHSLLKYQETTYWKEHPTIRFDTLYEEGEYEVMAAFYDRVYYANEDCFKFYKFVKASDEADYRNAIEQYRKKSIYDTGVTAEYGDKLITLVTCAYHTENGRFVVVARRK